MTHWPRIPVDAGWKKMATAVSRTLKWRSRGASFHTAGTLAMSVRKRKGWTGRVTSEEFDRGLKAVQDNLVVQSKV